VERKKKTEGELKKKPGDRDERQKTKTEDEPE
jgi:hypothetical protein